VAGYYGSVSVLLGKGDGKFGKAKKYSLNGNAIQVVTDDFNMDGKLDIAVTASGANAFVFFGKGDGNFQPVTQVGSGQGAGHLAAGDFNRDGKPDLVAIDVGSVTVLLNVTKKKNP